MSVTMKNIQQKELFKKRDFDQRPLASYFTGVLFFGGFFCIAVSEENAFRATCDFDFFVL